MSTSFILTGRKASRLVVNHPRRNEWHVSNVYMRPLFFSSGSERQVGSAAFSPLCLLRACVTASIHHPDTGALTETVLARPCLRMMTYLPFHSVRCASILSPITVTDPPSQTVHNLCLSLIQSIPEFWFHFFVSHNFFFVDELISGSKHLGSDIDTPLTLPGSPLQDDFPAPPGGNGGRKNAEAGSKFPPGRLLDGEAERRTDDNGREAGAWESPQGDLHPHCVLAPAATLSAPRWGLHSGFGKVIPSADTPPSTSISFPPHPSLLFLPSLTPNQKVMSWRWRHECYLQHYRFVSSFFFFCGGQCISALLLGNRMAEFSCVCCDTCA